MKTHIEILIDNSNSMGKCEGLENHKQYLLPDSSTRMELSKKILINEILPTLDYAEEINVNLFHAIGNSNKLKITPIYKGKNNELLIEKIKEIPIPTSTGGTPITDAVKSAIHRLKELTETDRKIILITDGAETGGKDYKVATEYALKSSGIPFNVFIIGIALDKLAEKKARELATKTNGHFVNFQNENYNSESITSKVSTFKNSIVYNSVSKVVNKIQTLSPKIVAKNNGIEIENNKFLVIEKNISEHSNLLHLISKQLNFLQNEISTLSKKETNYDDENLIIFENKELNNKIGKVSERIVYEKLKDKFGKTVIWENENKESGKSYDFKIIDTTDNSINYYIECKGTIGEEKVFFLTKNEWELFLNNKYKYQIYLVNNALSNPKITKIENLLDWLLNGKIFPYPLRNRKIKAERIILTLK